MNAEKRFNAMRAAAATAVLSLAVAVALAAPSPAPTPPVVVDLPAPQSVFIDQPGFGRDPFFPNSQRRGAVAHQHTVEPVANFNNLMLKGISVSSERRLAIINNKTLAVGEEADIRVAGQFVRVKCAEIRDTSVVIMVNGVSKELSLSQR